MSGADDRLAEAVSRHQGGDLLGALAAYKRILQQHPDHAACQHLLGVALLQSGRVAEALEALQRSIELAPGEPAFLTSLGAARRAAGQPEEAAECYRRALALNPGYAAAHANLGNVLLEMGQAAAARDSLLLAVQLEANQAGWHYTLGLAAQRLGLTREAAGHYRQALGVQPDHAPALNNLGNLRSNAGDLTAALECFDRAVARQPGYAPAQANRAGTLLRLGRLEEAGAAYKAALDMAPEDPAINRAYSIFLWRRGRLVEARERAAVSARGTSDRQVRALGLSQLATTEAYLSDYARVAELSAAALELSPTDPVIWSQRLYSLSYHPDLSAADIFGEFVRWGDGQQVAAPSSCASDRTPGRRLRVGFVSPDFRRHTSRFYFAPLFEHYDREAIELIGYSNVQQPDEWTEKFRGWSSGWREIRGLSDAEVAEQVRADGIDILIDGCNHMQDHRLGV
ncbi:MAG: tetratricopeptide repeat protein, partial [Oceanibaculum nanhaiense]|uniref:tetratricopeptide repeat protein n=1 Tax=Oceanibaculum nanhaiense TaxID=1909734 RepID=UPI0032EEF5F3